MRMFLRFLAFARPYRWRLLGMVLLLFISLGMGMVMPALMGQFIDRMKTVSSFQDTLHGRVTTKAEVKPLAGHARAPREEPPPKAVRPPTPVELRLTQNDAFKFLILICALMLGLRLASAAISVVHSLTVQYVSQRVLFDMRTRIYRHLQKLSLRYYETRQSGRIMSRLLYDVEAIQSVLGGSIIEIITNVATLIIALIILFVYNWRLAMIVFVALPLYGINFAFLRRKIHNAAADVREKWSDLSGSAWERVAGVRIVKSFVREKYETRRFMQDIRENLKLQLALGRWSVLLNTVAGLLTGFATVAVWWFGGRSIIFIGDMTLGELTAFVGYMGMTYGPITTIVRINETVTAVMAAVERIFETLDTMPDVADADDAVTLDQVEGEITFDHVDFAYEPGQLVLEDITFTAQPGQMIALVGPSGGGKSTLVNLIPRFYDPVDGVVTLDGLDLRKIKQSSLRKHIGMVLQDTFLFSGTIRENIKYGKPDATDDEVIQAAIAANAHDFIMEFPDGYETEVGERGSRLSGGQRQRVSIARAILRNPKILILDEATSALDSEAEALIQEALDHLMKGRTTFAIAHRLSTVMNADEILVVEDGKICERGVHAELATAGGVYERLCEVQFKKAEEKVREHQASLKAREEEAQQAAAEATPSPEGDSEAEQPAQEGESAAEPAEAQAAEAESQGSTSQ
jgi:subfamily B ATP-binding cassette protein MsbA